MAQIKSFAISFPARNEKDVSFAEEHIADNVVTKVTFNQQ